MPHNNIGTRLLGFLFKYGLYFAILLLCIVFAVLSPRFLTISNLTNILVQAAVIAIIGIGMTFIMLTGGIDISVGSNLFLAGAVGAVMMRGGLHWTAGIVLILLTGTCVGLFNGLAITKLKVIPLITTLAMLNVVRGLALQVTDISIVVLPDQIRLFGGTIGFLPVPIIAVAISYAIGQFTLSSTPLGRQIYAVGNNESAARDSGIDTQRVKLLVYIIGGFTTGLGSLIWCGQLAAVQPGMGVGMEFIVITAVIIGGTSIFGGEGRLFPGTLGGALLLVIIENGLNLINASPYAYDIVKGIVILAAVCLDLQKHRYRGRGNLTIPSLMNPGGDVIS